MSKNEMSKDNRRLRQQLTIAQDELRTIKGSKAFSTIRLVGHAKSQLRQSPVSFLKKSLKKVTKGNVYSKSVALRANLLSKDSLQSQYQHWIILNEPDNAEFEDQKLRSDQFVKKPLISIITPVFNPPSEVFVELIESVLGQTYSNFELCLGNFGDSLEIKSIIKDYSQRDKRIRSLSFNENKGIAENSNLILSKAEGEYIALLDHDDTISRDALFENVKLLNEEDYDFIYSDKDKIDEKGNRFEPFFKPGWSPEIMLNANYLTHLNVMKTSLVKKVGSWDKTTDGAQDWDLFLKVVSVSKKIGHIQKVLYHWRVIATSTAMSIETKPYALEGQRKAVDYYLKKENIPASSYHVGAELLLNWKSTPKETMCIVNAHSSSHMYSFVNSLNLQTNIDISVKFFILHDFIIENIQNNKLHINYVQYDKGEYLNTIKNIATNHSEANILFFDDRVKPDLNKATIRSLTGWLDISGVKAAGPRIIDNKQYAIDCGAMITSYGIKPLFFMSPPYHQAPLGNIEWVRDMALISPLVFVVTANNITKILTSIGKIKISDNEVNSAIQLKLSTQGRLVFNPKVKFIQLPNTHIDTIEQYDLLEGLPEKLSATDPYLNINLSNDNPMELTDIVRSNMVDENFHGIDFGYQLEAGAHAAGRTLSKDVMEKNLDTIQKEGHKPLKKVEDMIIFLPDFYGIYAGLNNIFSYANYFYKKGTRVQFALMSSDTTFERQRNLIIEKFPELGLNSKICSVSNENVSTLPRSDVAVCTQWATAYLLAAYNKTQRKCYFIQDKESSFYPKGTISALVDNTYKLSFTGIANTPGLLDWYKKEYGGKGVVIKSNVDLSKYHPSKSRNVSPSSPFKVFFYARPNEPRNAFELAVAALTLVKESMGERVEIYAAGADWSPEEYGLDSVMTNLGKIDYNKLPTFYRSMDVGIMFMFSGHPGVVASELMASGCPVIVNEYDDNTWRDLYQDEVTCLVSVPTAEEVSRNIQRLLEDKELRSKVIDGGLNKINEFYANYTKSLDDSYKYLTKPNA